MLQQLGLKKAFDAVVVSVARDHIILTSRYNYDVAGVEVRVQSIYTIYAHSIVALCLGFAYTASAAGR